MKADERRAIAISYITFFLILAVVAALSLTTILITILFSYFILSKLHFAKKGWPAVLIFVLLVVVVFCGFVFFLKRASSSLPEIVRTSIPIVIDFADRYGIKLPFDDMQSLRDVAMEGVSGTLGYLGNFAKIATKEFVLLLIGVIIAISLFLDPDPDGHGVPLARSNNLYAQYIGLLGQRFRALFRSFQTVMGAQLLISTINTVFTAIFVLVCHLPYSAFIIALTFFCGLLPIVGNIISNTVITGVAFKVSPQMAGAALTFLVVIHKLEYLLNSKIIGSRIKHPMWLTLLALIFGERLMGIPGLVLAPVLLNFVKVESSQYPVNAAAPVQGVPTPEKLTIQ
jgi:predicted PurR-regulated permease PerM